MQLAYKLMKAATNPFEEIWIFRNIGVPITFMLEFECNKAYNYTQSRKDMELI